eukprot:TRINITY_DN2469_c0_g3_i1.p1 TRINITY_DN2469_c0_g3~~TRINITY_DN2469_c0_g3_i1.p1  ORF type:complete len:298 (-),score=62.86 TRINITY_DN2469_c0_g3_i1:282-1175(-)
MASDRNLRNRGIMTLSDLNRPSGSADSDSDSDRPQEYYTGGEKSGMAVQDPSKKGSSSNVDDIFEKAKQMGASEALPVDDRSPSAQAFTGTGRLLSGDTTPTTPQAPRVVVHEITFWRNGFTVDNGPLRGLDDPANASFLESLRRSVCPIELQPADRSTEVEIRLAKRDEDCPIRAPTHVPFQGVGRTLGGSSSSDPEMNVAKEAVCNSRSTQGFSVDDSQPVTSIQIRLSDGTRLVSRFNYHHTVADIRAFINAARPGGAAQYQLQAMGFPPRLLDDPEQSIEKAGLINSVVIQKL